MVYLSIDSQTVYLRGCLWGAPPTLSYPGCAMEKRSAARARWDQDLPGHPHTPTAETALVHLQYCWWHPDNKPKLLSHKSNFHQETHEDKINVLIQGQNNLCTAVCIKGVGDLNLNIIYFSSYQIIIMVDEQQVWFQKNTQPKLHLFKLYWIQCWTRSMLKIKFISIVEKGMNMPSYLKFSNYSVCSMNIWIWLTVIFLFCTTNMLKLKLCSNNIIKVSHNWILPWLTFY